MEFVYILLNTFQIPILLENLEHSGIYSFARRALLRPSRCALCPFGNSNPSPHTKRGGLLWTATYIDWKMMMLTILITKITFISYLANRTGCSSWTSIRESSCTALSSSQRRSVRWHTSAFGRCPRNKIKHLYLRQKIVKCKRDRKKLFKVNQLRKNGHLFTNTKDI